MFVIHGKEISQQNTINTTKAGLDLLHSKIAMHEHLHCELRLPSGTTYRGEIAFLSSLTSVRDIKYEMEAVPRGYECTN